jgi:SAM-dependent methyltransferase
MLFVITLPHMTQHSLTNILKKAWTRVIPNARYLPQSRLRTCRACRRFSLFIAIGEEEEFHICVRCRANLRYELLAGYLRKAAPNLSALDVLELDPDSPLQPILSAARVYVRSFFRPDVKPGTRRSDGSVCEDITALTFGDESLDLIVSSDVLEHVPDAVCAFRESARVLRRGGAHIFTVPPRPVSRQRAKIVNGETVIVHPPAEYHRDPLDPKGVLVYWDYGPDLPDAFPTPGLRFSLAEGPEGMSGRTVWEARKI